jgi:8-oxo-dGTP diphosphatase
MYSGELTLDNLHREGIDDTYIKEVKWFNRDEIQHVTVFPELLKDEFWNDMAASFKEVRYLGAQKG